MNKEDEKKRRLYGQFAWILNYQPKIKEQHIHMGNQEVEDTPAGEEAEYEELKADKQKSNDKVDGVKDKQLNYKTPTIVLQRMLEGDWLTIILPTRSYIIRNGEQSWCLTLWHRDTEHI